MHELQVESNGSPQATTRSSRALNYEFAHSLTRRAFIYDMVRVASDNRGMQAVSYLVEPRAAMEWTARQVGFVQDLYLEPVDRWRHGERVLGQQFHTIFQGTIPAIWRWVKP